MTPANTHFDGNPDDKAMAESEQLSAYLARLQPLAPRASVRSRIAAEITERPATWLAHPAHNRLHGIGVRLMWASWGAVVASLVFLLTGRTPWLHDQAAARPAHDAGLVEPFQPSVPQVHEDAGSWFDEGIRFIDATTPTRVLRRKVIERHLARDGTEEIRVPREDVMVLPVALR